MRPSFRENRESWVLGGRVVELAAEVAKDDAGGPQLEEQQGDYFKPGDEADRPLEIDAQEDFETVEEQLRMEAALLHPRARTEHQEKC